MYKNIKSRVVFDKQVSDYFPCTTGVRQGENLSPLLFLLYMNDLTDFLVNRNITGLSSISDSLEQELDVYLKIFILLYADDTVLMSESKDDLQHQLNEFSEYCDLWKLNVNVSKTKVPIFSKGRAQNCDFFLKNNLVEVVKGFNYLGILFSNSGSFTKAKKVLSEKATKAMFGILK